MSFVKYRSLFVRVNFNKGGERTMVKKIIILIVVVVIVIAAILVGLKHVKTLPKETQAKTGSFYIQNIGLLTPETVLYDPENDVYLVSNINGGPFIEDDNGFISRIDPDGKVIELAWINGADGAIILNAPKGMTFSENRLYVCDIDAVRLFDRESGEHLVDIRIPEVTFVNGATTGPDGRVYITDSGFSKGDNGAQPTGRDAVYVIDQENRVQTLCMNSDLNRPNGIVYTKTGNLYVVPFGGNELFQVHGDGTYEVAKILPSGSLDGLVELNDNRLAVSSWKSMTIYLVDVAGNITVLVKGVRSPAGIGYDSKRDRVLIPLFRDNKILVQDVK